MSFADKAIEAVLEELKREGKEFVFREGNRNTRKQILFETKYGLIEQDDFRLPEEILEQRSVPDIINAFKKYYIEFYDDLVNPWPLKVADSYGISNFHKTTNSYDLLDFSEEKDVPLFVAEPDIPYNNIPQKMSPFDDPVDDLEQKDDFGDDDITDYPGCAKAAPNLAYRKKSKEEILKDLDKSLQDYLKAPEETVSDFVIKKLNELNLKPSDVYKPVFMTRQNYSKIISNYTKHPKFGACIQLALGLKLDLADTTELLRRAGNAFSDDIYDRVIKYFIENKKYDIFELNVCLDIIGEKPIGSY